MCQTSAYLSVQMRQKKLLQQKQKNSVNKSLSMNREYKPKISFRKCVCVSYFKRTMIFFRDINIYKYKWMFWWLLCVFPIIRRSFATSSTAPIRPPYQFSSLYQKLNCLFWDLFYLLVNRWFNSKNFARILINDVTMTH